MSGSDDNRDVAVAVFFADKAQDAKAIEDWHVDVKEDDIYVVMLKKCINGGGVCCGFDVGVFFFL